ncbi:AraC family transcriptional regulator [Arsenicibacter rosenii]|uniref:AraC family transcriptional regulator n=1 Tax=Arsenicibacter rosenii TaxID=1750698 RepID=A0A1S2VKN6_9BACT|nr:AraC family transcriptional regulator [Arsenicibacter rosenii]OIN59324.1 AraC family transcriptional regulator [Arsenicibacter rosenii]
MNAYQHQFMWHLLAYAVQRNVSLPALCRANGIDEPAFRAGRLPDLTEQQVVMIWQQIGAATNDPLLGLHLGESLQLAALGVVGDLVKFSRTIGEGVMQAAAMLPLVTELWRMDVETEGAVCTIRFTPERPEGSQPLSFLHRHMLDMLLAFTLHEVNGLVFSRIAPVTVGLPYETAETAEYARVLRCDEIRTGGACYLTFDRHVWHEPVLTANYEMQQYFLKKAGEMMQEKALRQSLRDRVESYLMTNAYLGIPTIEAIAANFNTSARSLQRHLQEEGVTYQQLADQVRKTLALHYLEVRNYPVKEISYLLGYNELSAFTRAFRRWTGTSPSMYRS